MELILLFFSVFVLSILGPYLYLYLANRFKVHAVPNYRSLHSKIVPRGGGLVIAVSVLLGVSGAYLLDYVSTRLFVTFLLGGILGTVVGFADDIMEVKAVVRLFVQIGLALIMVIYAKLYPNFSQSTHLILAKLCGSALLVFCIVWFFNSFNFIDGSDGMAISSVVYVSGVVTAILLFRQEYAEAIVFSMLLLSSLGFLYFNWPPAKVFLGDSGSFFLGYSLCFLMFDTVSKGFVSVWLWLILFAYYFSDTILTNLVRALIVPQWYKPHRSHAYQNLARSWGHLKILVVVLIINIFWLLPLALLTLVFPHYEYVFLISAYAPICLFVLKRGPLYENK